MLALPLSVPVLAAFPDNTCYSSLGVVSTYVVHHNIKRLLRIIADYRHHAFHKVLGNAVSRKIKHSVGKRIVHNAVKLFSEQKFSPLTVREFVCGVLPNLAEQKSLGLRLFNRKPYLIEKNVGQFVGNVKPPTVCA